MERGPTEQLLESPEHPYTRGLLSCLLEGDDDQSRLPTIEGSVPERFEDGPGCPFASRCSYATEYCSRSDPPVIDAGPDHEVMCAELDAVRDASAAVGGGTTTSVQDDGSASQRTVETDRRSATNDGVAADGASELVDLPAGGEQSDRRNVPTQPDPVGGAWPEQTTRRSDEPILEAQGVSRTFDLTESSIARLLDRERTLRAVDDVDLAVYPDETIGIVGESGSGKSTLAELLTGLQVPTEGEILFEGEPVGIVEERTADQLADVGVVFQNPRASINPRQRVRDAIAEPLRERGWEASRRRSRVRELLELVDLPEGFASRRPHQLSGGQLQRVAIARAIALEPRILVLDEPVSALDVSVRARLLNLLVELQRRLGLTIVVISHDLDVVRHVADRVAVMYLGRVVERGPASVVFDRPAHPYTAALLDAVPRVTDDGEPVRLEGPVPSAVDAPAGCSFHPRCPIAEPECEASEPEHEAVGEACSRCHFADEVAARGVRDAGTTAGDAHTDCEPEDGDASNTADDRQVHR